MTIVVVEATTDEQISATFHVMRQLRPDLDTTLYIRRIRQMMASDNFRLAYLTDDGAVCAVAGFRLMEMLYCGPLLSVDDLVTDEAVRSKGYGAILLDWLKTEGRRTGCKELQLVSRVTREEAHRFYFRHGLGIDCFHFRATLQA
jgi:GNAT superfamily N-acetyltransferase